MMVLYKYITDDEIAMNQRMKQARTELHLTQKEFAAAANLNVSVVLNIENNIIKPNKLYFDLLCSAHNINKQWIETGKGKMLFRRRIGEKGNLNTKAMTVGYRIHLLRRRYLSLSQKEMAQRLQIDSTWLARIESDKRIARPYLIKNISDEFHVNPVWLETGIGEIFITTSNKAEPEPLPSLPNRISMIKELTDMIHKLDDAGIRKLMSAAQDILDEQENQ